VERFGNLLRVRPLDRACRNGSLATDSALQCDFRSTPESGHPYVGSPVLPAAPFQGLLADMQNSIKSRTPHSPI